jgi:demethylmenaquinone methyltransferase/2-methoxy-6-polyprenyl-1,4-benzoquinol methylase
MREQAGDELHVTRVRRSKEDAQILYDRLSGWYDLLAGSSEEKYVRAGLQQLKIEAGERVLEIGFGTGKVLVALAQGVGRSGQVYGIDISEGMAQRARGRLERAELRDRVALIRGDGARLPLKDRVLDAVFMSFTLELFDTPRLRLVLHECRRVLEEGGRLCVVSMARRGDPSLPVRVYEWVHQRLPQYIDCRPIPVENVMEDAGFEITDVERRSMWGLPVDIVMGKEGET